MIAVAAITRSGARASYSNTGRVTIAAPGGGAGSGILSTVNTGFTSPAADGYAFFQGTSMATPHVAGTASLMLSANPTLTPAQVRQLMQGSARAFPVGTESDCRPGMCGAGIVDAGAAVAAALAGAPLRSSTARARHTTNGKHDAPSPDVEAVPEEGGVCRFSGTRQVRYGGKVRMHTNRQATRLHAAIASSAISAYGALKSCQYAN